MLRFLFALSLVLWPLSATAQTFPDYQSTFVNDFAELLPPDREQALVTALQDNRKTTGIETVVVTLNGDGLYPTGWMMEDYATALFNHWGVGHAERNDGVMILILPDLRAMRVELGAGYATGYDDLAQAVIDDYFLPAFKTGDYATGIEQGTRQILTRIVDTRAAGAPPPEPSSGDGGIGRLLLVGMGMLFVFLMAKGFLRDKIAGFGRCPSCGQRGLNVARRVTKRATKSTSGQGWRTLSCKHCDWSDRSQYSIPRRSSSSGSSSFGGGSSSGGGASGRW